MDQDERKKENARKKELLLQIVRGPIPQGFNLWAPLLQVKVNDTDVNTGKQTPKIVLYPLDPSKVFLEKPQKETKGGPPRDTCRIYFLLDDPARRLKAKVAIVLQKSEWSSTQFGAKIKLPTADQNWSKASFDSSWYGMESNPKLLAEFYTIRAFEDRIIDLVWENRKTWVQMSAATPREVIADLMTNRATTVRHDRKNPDVEYAPTLEYNIKKTPGPSGDYDVKVYEEGSKGTCSSFRRLVEMRDAGDKVQKHKAIFRYECLNIKAKELTLKPDLLQVVIPQVKSLQNYSFADVVPDNSEALTSFFNSRPAAQMGIGQPPGGPNVEDVNMQDVNGNPEPFVDDGGQSPMLD